MRVEVVPSELKIVFPIIVDVVPSELKIVSAKAGVTKNDRKIISSNLFIGYLNYVICLDYP